MTFRSRKYPNFSYNLFGKFQGTRTFICCHFSNQPLKPDMPCNKRWVRLLNNPCSRSSWNQHQDQDHPAPHPFWLSKELLLRRPNTSGRLKIQPWVFLWRCILHPNPNYWCSMDVPPLPLPWVPAKHMFQLRKVEEIYFHWWSSMQTFRILVYMEWSGAQNRPKSIRGKQCMYRFHYIGSYRFRYNFSLQFTTLSYIFQTNVLATIWLEHLTLACSVFPMGVIKLLPVLPLLATTQLVTANTNAHQHLNLARTGWT